MGQPLGEAAAIATAALAASARVKLEGGAAITAAELAALTGVDERTVHRQAREGRYPSLQPTGPGGARRFSPENVADIRRAINREVATAGAPA